MVDAFPLIILWYACRLDRPPAPQPYAERTSHRRSASRPRPHHRCGPRDPGRTISTIRTYRTIYEAIRRLYEERKPIDFVTVAEALKGHKTIAPVGGSAFLGDLANNVPTASHAGHYADDRPRQGDAAAIASTWRMR